MWIMIAGPYRSGAASPAQRAANLRAMNVAALEVFRRGHVPIIGVNAVAPIIDVAGPESYDELMMPICLQLADRCDAVLRIGGPSEGADQELQRFVARGLPVFTRLDEVPTLGPPGA